MLFSLLVASVYAEIPEDLKTGSSDIVNQDPLASELFHTSEEDLKSIDAVLDEVEHNSLDGLALITEEEKTENSETENSETENSETESSENKTKKKSEAGSNSLQSASFSKELMSIEEEVSELKEKVFHSKATLKLLREIVVQGAVSGARAKVYHSNELGRGFALEGVHYYFDRPSEDNVLQYKSRNTMGFTERSEILNSEIAPGEHKLYAQVSVRGNGLGVFDYVEGYSFNIQSATSFTINEGDECIIEINLKQHSSLTHSYYERPYIQFIPICQKMTEMD